jgi:magnesium-transporting ATPase (P-type)
MDAALRTFAADHRFDPAPQIATYRFDPQRKRMSVLIRRGGSLVISSKGAPESVLPLCVTRRSGSRPVAIGDADRQRVLAAVDEMAGRGLRVLALASRNVAETPSTAAAAEQDLCLVGLVGLLDPPRPEVPEAVQACHAAGLRVNVITGDHARTAAEIARRVGIDARTVVSGPTVDAMTDGELDALLGQSGEIVFARSTPEGKLRIAEALQRRGDTVAMTGDGVNDAPALHRADIGVAMGKSGTEVAREAATMVLTDDNFATIVTAVREGRRAYENLRKFVLYIFAHAVPEVIPFAVFALSAGAIPLPLTVLQILAIDLGTETLPALALGRERAEPDIMDRPPRARHEPLITRRLLGRAWFVMGSVSAVLALGAFFLTLHIGGWHLGADTAVGTPLHHVWQQATTATFLTIVACQVGTAVAARTDRASLRSVGLFTNRLLLAGIAFELVFAAILVYAPGVDNLFGTTAPPPVILAVLIPCPFLVWGVDELYRAHGRGSRAARRPPLSKPARLSRNPRCISGRQQSRRQVVRHLHRGTLVTVQAAVASVC